LELPMVKVSVTFETKNGSKTVLVTFSSMFKATSVDYFLAQTDKIRQSKRESSENHRSYLFYGFMKTFE
jgi:hypothetical protein